MLTHIIPHCQNCKKGSGKSCYNPSMHVPFNAFCFCCDKPQSTSAQYLDLKSEDRNTLKDKFCMIHCENCPQTPDNCFQLMTPQYNGCAACFNDNKDSGITMMSCGHQGSMTTCPCCGKHTTSSASYIMLNEEERLVQKNDFCNISFTRSDADIVLDRKLEKKYRRAQQDIDLKEERIQVANKRNTGSSAK
jgi:hypothetical protein